ncbi:hypothetical protein PCASD_05171 [Puccinia coronata f. sp. avenae]|uniref:Uncharacterized protein n=1 Tax=Puccinia coronata f. sp. avenae TaxID=200324 RepID=A0A2N5V3L1_9BASI|nr:hypothetical protein PCASD_05171 [Puccinia coronata f. sp. avenae]
MEILEFIQELENAAMQDGAQAEDIATQISSFITNQNILKEIKDMSCKLKNDWEILKYQMGQQWGKMMPLMKYTRENLENLIFKARTNGGIQTLKQFQDFSTKVDTIVNYLVRCRHMANIEEIRHSVLNCLTPTIQLAVNKELIRDNQMDVAIDGSYLLPPYKTIIQYIHKELKTMSILEMEEDVFKKAVSDKNQTTQRTTQIPTQSAPVKDQEVEQLTKSLSSWNAQKQPITFYQSSNVPYQPAQNIKPPEQQFCQYCYMRGHPTGRCNLANFDEIQGLVKREERDFKLPDGSTIPWERNRPYKMAVDQFHSKTSQQGIIQSPPQTQTQNPEQKVPEVQISFGIIEEMETTCNLECDSHKDYVSGILPTHSVITPAFTLEENNQLESIDQSQEAPQGHRITQLEGTSPEHSPVMAIVDNQELEQSNYKSIIPPEKSVEEDKIFASTLDPPEEIQFLGNNSPTLLPEGMQHPEEPILEEPQIPDKSSPIAMDRNQPPDKTPHKWPNSEEAEKIKGQISAFDPTVIVHFQITSPPIILQERIRHPPCFKNPKTSIISHQHYLLEEEPVEVRSRIRANSQPSEFGILEHEEFRKKNLTSTSPIDPRILLPIHQHFEEKFKSKKRARIKKWEPINTYNFYPQPCEVF